MWPILRPNLQIHRSHIIEPLITNFLSFSHVTSGKKFITIKNKCLTNIYNNRYYYSL